MFLNNTERLCCLNIWWLFSVESVLGIYRHRMLRRAVALHVGLVFFDHLLGGSICHNLPCFHQQHTSTHASHAFQLMADQNNGLIPALNVCNRLVTLCPKFSVAYRKD